MDTVVAPGFVTKEYKILIVDDHPVIRKIFTELLGKELDLHAREGADNAEEAFAQIRVTRPDLVLLDIVLKTGSGIELISRIRNFDALIKILVFSTYDEKIYAERAIRAGATGYLSKRESRETILAAIRQALQDDLLSNFATTRHRPVRVQAEELKLKSAAALSNREIEVFRLLGQGMTTKAIAKLLGRSKKTIESHRGHIKEKLYLKNASELNCQATQWYLQNG